MPLFSLYSLLPCVLCDQVRAVQHRVCQDCWNSLRWKQTTISRQQLECYVLCDYAFPTSKLITQFKEHHQLQYLKTLEGILLQAPRPDVQAIVPMPISTEKLIQRGFSHTYLLAKALAKSWKLPIWQPVNRSTGQGQRFSEHSERLLNAQTQMYLNDTHSYYQHVLMLDDVITTGASLAALDFHLKKRGCETKALCICDARIS